MSIRDTLARCAVRLLATGMLLLFAAVPAQADLILNVQSVTAAAGSTNNALDVTLTNNGPSAVTIGGASFGLMVSSTNITFTSATTGTTLAPYIFDGQSAFGPTISTTPPGQTLEASDVFAVFGSGTTVGAGMTVGLGRVLFNVAPGTAPGPYPVTVQPFAFTGLIDPSGLNNIPITTLNGGNITVIGATAPVPEPSTLLLAGLGWPAAWLLRRRRGV
jgi:hypothetical protein